MSDNGDFYIGNIKYSATSGTQTTFDIPIPTIAGQLASSNSVVFYEVIINRRLFVAGGETNEVLSQFDGPVKFTNSVTIQARLSVSDIISAEKIEVNSTDNTTAPTNGALKVRGGVGIERDLRLGGNLYVSGNATVGILTVREDLTFDDATDKIIVNIIEAYDGAEPMRLWENQVNGKAEISIGGDGDQDKVIFNTTKLGSGEGGSDDIQNSDGGVDIKGSLVVREKVIAKEFIGDGLGKPGSILMWGGNATEDNEQTLGSIPKGYLLCDGRTISATTYPKLFKAIRYTHGGSGNSFRLTDLRNNFIVGAAGNYTVASRGGANTVTLTQNQIPGHTHGVNSASTAHGHSTSGSTDNRSTRHNHGANVNGNGGHSHSGGAGGGGHGHGGSAGGGGHGHGNYVDSINVSRQSYKSCNTAGVRNVDYNRRGGGSGNHGHNFNVGGGGHNHNFNTNNNGHSHGASVNTANQSHSHNVNGNTSQNNSNHNHNTNSTGGGGSHENRPPYYALCFIIQYK